MQIHYDFLSFQTANQSLFSYLENPLQPLYRVTKRFSGSIKLESWPCRQLIRSQTTDYWYEHTCCLAFVGNASTFQFSGRKDVDASDVTGKPVDTYSESSLILMNRGVQKTLKTLRQAANFSLGSKPSRVSFVSFSSCLYSTQDLRRLS